MNRDAQRQTWATIERICGEPHCQEPGDVLLVPPPSEAERRWLLGRGYQATRLLGRQRPAPAKGQLRIVYLDRGETADEAAASATATAYGTWGPGDCALATTWSASRDATALAWAASLTSDYRRMNPTDLKPVGRAQLFAMLVWASFARQGLLIEPMENYRYRAEGAKQVGVFRVRRAADLLRPSDGWSAFEMGLAWCCYSVVVDEPRERWDTALGAVQDDLWAAAMRGHLGYADVPAAVEAACSIAATDLTAHGILTP